MENEIMGLSNDGKTYLVDRADLKQETDSYRLYLCKEKGTGKQYLLKIAVAMEDNAGLEREVYVLNLLARRAEELENAYSQEKADPESFLNYQIGIPAVVDSFILDDEDPRRVTILTFTGVEDLDKITSLSIIIEENKLRVDPKTSAWIMGKALKMLVFAHGEDVAVGAVDANNILIVPEEHYVVIFDWSGAQFNSGPIAPETMQREITEAARAVIDLLGGDLGTNVFPNDWNEDANTFNRYTKHLLSLARGNESSAERAHKLFYQLIRSLWERKFHEFTAKKR